MTAVAVPPGATRADQLRFATDWPNPSQVRIAVHGDIDACNAQDLVDYVFRRAANSKSLILDMHGVEFFSTAGFARLRTIEVRCTRANVDWTLIPSRAVSRVLDICDPRSSLPVEAG